MVMLSFLPAVAPGALLPGLTLARPRPKAAADQAEPAPADPNSCTAAGRMVQDILMTLRHPAATASVLADAAAAGRAAAAARSSGAGADSLANSWLRITPEQSDRLVDQLKKSIRDEREADRKRRLEQDQHKFATLQLAIKLALTAGDLRLIRAIAKELAALARRLGGLVTPSARADGSESADRTPQGSTDSPAAGRSDSSGSETASSTSPDSARSGPPGGAGAADTAPAPSGQALAAADAGAPDSGSAGGGSYGRLISTDRDMTVSITENSKPPQQQAAETTLLIRRLLRAIAKTLKDLDQQNLPVGTAVQDSLKETNGIIARIDEQMGGSLPEDDSGTPTESQMTLTVSLSVRESESTFLLYGDMGAEAGGEDALTGTSGMMMDLRA